MASKDKYLWNSQFQQFSTWNIPSAFYEEKTINEEQHGPKPLASISIPPDTASHAPTSSTSSSSSSSVSSSTSTASGIQLHTSKLKPNMFPVERFLFTLACSKPLDLEGWCERLHNEGSAVSYVVGLINNKFPIVFADDPVLHISKDVQSFNDLKFVLDHAKEIECYDDSFCYGMLRKPQSLLLDTIDKLSSGNNKEMLRAHVISSRDKQYKDLKSQPPPQNKIENPASLSINRSLGGKKSEADIEDDTHERIDSENCVSLSEMIRLNKLRKETEEEAAREKKKREEEDALLRRSNTGQEVQKMVETTDTTIVTKELETINTLKSNYFTEDEMIHWRFRTRNIAEQLQKKSKCKVGLNDFLRYNPTWIPTELSSMLHNKMQYITMYQSKEYSKLLQALMIELQILKRIFDRAFREKDLKTSQVQYQSTKSEDKTSKTKLT
jgi:hypothetical protein